MLVFTVDCNWSRATAWPVNHCLLASTLQSAAVQCGACSISTIVHINIEKTNNEDFFSLPGCRHFFPPLSALQQPQGESSKLSLRSTFSNLAYFRLQSFPGATLGKLARNTGPNTTQYSCRPEKILTLSNILAFRNVMDIGSHPLTSTLINQYLLNWRNH